MVPEEFRPVLLSRRGEAIAWGSALLVFFGWLVLAQSGRPAPWMVPFLAVFLLTSALAISLGNWMDRQTVLRLEPSGVEFHNGVRNVRLRWDQIREVQVIPSGWGKKVSVIGQEAHFDFRTLGEVKVQGEVKGRVGFPDGEKILSRILEASGLKAMRKADSGYYYARE